MVHFLILPSDYLGKQRCYLNSELIKRFSLKIGDAVEISNGVSFVICCVFVRQDLQEDYCYFDNIVSNCLNTECQNKDFLNDASITKLQVSSPVTVNVSVVTNSFKHLSTYKNNVKILTEKIYAILSQNVCVKGSIVDCRRHQLGSAFDIHCIIVNDFDAVTLAVKINSQTGIKVNQILSSERFFHLQKKNSQALGGLERPYQILKEHLLFQLQYPDVLQSLGLRTKGGILLVGPSGCGKTSLVKKLANDCEASLFSVCCSNLSKPLPGESEKTVRNIFLKAKQLSEEGPCVLFFDEIDSICSKNDISLLTNSRRVISQLLTLLDDVNYDSQLLVIAATSRPHVLIPALRRHGRFDFEIFINMPTVEQRFNILQVLTENLSLRDKSLLEDIAKRTPGYAGVDLVYMVQSSLLSAYKKHQTLSELALEDFQPHLKPPSSISNSLMSVELTPTFWDDIGGLENVKKKMKEMIELPLTNPAVLQRLGIPLPRGVLIYGPPGCCKTTLVRAAATNSNVTFLSVSPAQIYSSFVGDSEKAIMQVFRQARSWAPTILFFDELDALVGNRNNKHGGKVQEKVLSTLLNEMDGIGIRVDDNQTFNEKKGLITSLEQKYTGVLVVAATNRPDLIDKALLRPGRFDRIIYVPPPNNQARKEILKICTKKMPVKDIDFDSIVADTELFSGADLEYLCQEAALHAISKNGIDVQSIRNEDFMEILKSLSPSLSKEKIEFYEQLHSKL